MTGNAGPAPAARAAQRLPILTYHALEDRPSPISLAPDLFRRQIGALAAAGWTALTLSQALEIVRHGKRPLARTVVLTFDDGLRSAYTHALPVLREHGYVATIFPVAGALGGANDWPGQPPTIPRLPLLSWDELGALAAAGWEIGGHTLGHPDLTALAPEAAEGEVAGGLALLAARLGRLVGPFAYPYGRWNATVRRLVARHCTGACTTVLAAAGRRSDPYALERIDVRYLALLAPEQAIRLLDSPLLLPYLAAWRALRSVRAKVAPGLAWGQ